MKRKLFTLLNVFAVVLCLQSLASCNKTAQSGEPEPEPEKPIEPKPVADTPKPGVYTFTAPSLKGGWEAGDKIYVHGSYGPAAQIITLRAEDISADGLTASGTLDKVTEFPLPGDFFYAAWPGEAVAENDGIMDESTTFDSLDRITAVAYLKDNNFAFVDASSILTFKVSGYTDFAFAGKQRAGLRFSSYSPIHTSAEDDFFTRATDNYPFIYGKVNEGEVSIIFPGTITFKGGFTIFLGDGTNWPAAYTVTEDTRMSVGNITDLGDITASLAEYTGPAPSLPEIGSYKKYDVKLNEMSGLKLSPEGDFLWAVGDNGDLAKIGFDGTVISKVHIGGDAEDVSLDPETGDLLIGLEPNSVGRVPAPEFNKMTKLFSIADAKKYDNAGLEGLTYYKDGLIYAGMQTGSELYLIELATGEVKMKKGLRETFSSITEIGGLCYDPLTDWLWIIDSEAKKIFALTGDAEQFLGSFSVKVVSNAESLAVDHAHSCIWVGDDYGSTSHLYRYEFTGLDDAIINK